MVDSKTISGIINANGEIVLLNTEGQSSIGIQISGTFTGTLQFEGTIDGTNWDSIPVFVPEDSTLAVSTTAVGLWIGSCAGLRAVRVRASAWTSGDAAISLMSALSGGGAGSGVSSLDGSTFTADTSEGTPMMGVYESTPSSLANNEIGMVGLDNKRAMKVRPSEYATDDSAMPATPTIMPVGGEYRATPTTYADGDAVVDQSDVNGNKKVTMATALAGEDLTNNVQGIMPKPTVSATYSGTGFTDLGALTKDNEKTTAAQLKSIDAQNENAAIRYLQIFNLAVDPTDDSSVPVFSFAIPAGTAAAPGIRSIGADFFGEGGYYLSTGFSWGISVDPDVFDETGVTAGEHQVNGIYI